MIGFSFEIHKIICTDPRAPRSDISKLKPKMTKAKKTYLKKERKIKQENNQARKTNDPTTSHDDTLATPTDSRTESKDLKISQRGVWESGKITLTWWVQNRDSIADAASWRSSSRKQTNEQTLRPEPQTRARAQQGKRENKRADGVPVHQAPHLP